MYNGNDSPQHKVPLLGDTSVGKTCIAHYISTGLFNSSTSANVGVCTIPVQIQFDKRIINISLWDTAGQETYRSLVPLYTRNAEIILLVFDISNRNSFNNLDKWIFYIRSEIVLKCPIFIVANKNDLDHEIQLNDIRKFASDNNCQIYLTSAKTGEGIPELFNAVAEKIISAETHESKFEAAPHKIGANEKKCCN